MSHIYFLYIKIFKKQNMYFITFFLKLQSESNQNADANVPINDMLHSLDCENMVDTPSSQNKH